MFFSAIDGNLVTPAETAGHLRGLTRVALQEACSAHGLDIVSRDIPLGDAARAMEGFITSATREVMPVRSLTLPDRRRGRISGGWRGSDAAGDSVLQGLCGTVSEEPLRPTVEQVDA